MIAFGIILIILFLFSLFGFKSDDAYSKQKTLFLKVFMAIAIILGHLSCRVPSGWTQPTRFWVAPIVSMFLFISGYLCQLIAMDALQLLFPSIPSAIYVLCTVVLIVLLVELLSFASHKVFAFGRKS